MNNTTSLTKMHHEMIKLRERAEKAEAELQKLLEQKHSRGNNHPYYAYIAGIIRKVNEEGCAVPVAAPAYKKCAGCNGHGMLGNGHPDCSDVVCHFCEGTGVDSSPAVPAPSVPDVLIRLRDKVTRIPHRKEYLGGQQFAYVRLCEVIGEIDDLLQSAEGYSSQAQNEVRHD